MEEIDYDPTSEREEEKNGKKPIWISVFLVLSPVVAMFYVADELSVVFEKANGSTFLWMIMQLLIGGFFISVLFFNCAYLDSKKQDSYLDVVHEKFPDVLRLVGMLLGVGLLAGLGSL